MVEPNLLLAAFLDRAGISHAGLAKYVNAAGADLGFRYDHASVARWIRDHAVPREPVPHLICAAINTRLTGDVTPVDIGMAKVVGRQPSLRQAVDRATALWHGEVRARLPRTTVTGAEAVTPVWNWQNPPDDEDVDRPGDRRIDQADVARLRRARAHYEQMYRRVGGVAVRPLIARVLTQDAAPMLRAGYDNHVGRELFRTIGSLAALAGVCAYDADQQPLAQRYLFDALRMAKASGNREFGVYVVALLANQALHLDDCRLVVQYAESALRVGGASLAPALLTDLHALAGKAYARMGDATVCRRHLRRSEQAAGGIRNGAGPAEASYVQPGLVEIQVAEALRRLGDLPAAHRYAEEAVRAAGSAHPRGRVHRYAGLALVLTDRGELDRAAHVADEMLVCAMGIDSGRIRDRVDTVVRALRAYAAEPVVGAFLGRVDEHRYRGDL